LVRDESVSDRTCLPFSLRGHCRHHRHGRSRPRRQVDAIVGPNSWPRGATRSLLRGSEGSVKAGPSSGSVLPLSPGLPSPTSSPPPGARHLDLLRRVLHRMGRGVTSTPSPPPWCWPVPGRFSPPTSWERRWSRHDRAYRLRRRDLPSRRHRVVVRCSGEPGGLQGVLSLSPPFGGKGLCGTSARKVTRRAGTCSPHHAAFVSQRC